MKRTAVSPKNHAPVVRLLAGVAFFLLAFAFIWWLAFRAFDMDNMQVL